MKTYNQQAIGKPLNQFHTALKPQAAGLILSRESAREAGRLVGYALFFLLLAGGLYLLLRRNKKRKS